VLYRAINLTRLKQGIALSYHQFSSRCPHGNTADFLKKMFQNISGWT
jgi:hypothetical protein